MSTFKFDLLFSGPGGETMVSILIEFHKFWAYENRETMVVDSNAEEQHQLPPPPVAGNGSSSSPTVVGQPAPPPLPSQQPSPVI